MGWLEELKGRVEYTRGMDSYMDCVEIATLDRLIAIAEKAEWSGRHDQFCVICGGMYGDDYHDTTCLYHENHKPQKEENHERNTDKDFTEED